MLLNFTHIILKNISYYQGLQTLKIWLRYKSFKATLKKSDNLKNVDYIYIDKSFFEYLKSKRLPITGNRFSVLNHFL